MVWHATCALRRAPERGLSETTTQSKPASLKSLAAVTSGEASRPRGGRISTKETKVPAASLAPSSLLEAAGSFSIGFNLGCGSTMIADRCTGWATCTASRISLMCSGVVPQQPPTTLTPACTKRAAQEAMYAGENRFLPSPALGRALSGLLV